jgi:hypothetical protein
MEAKDREREEARRLRAEGLSLGAIAKQLGVAKSSVSVWVRDIPGPPRPPKKPRPLGRPTTPETPYDPNEPLRYCSRGDHHVPESRFNRSGEGRQWWCRDCFKSYFRERGDKHRQQSNAARERRRLVPETFVRLYLSMRACVDCGEDDILVLEFDHCRGKKHGKVGTLVAEGAAFSVVRSEVEKCEVVCVNCHRRRTARRAGTFRATGVRQSSWTTAQHRNQLHLLSVLRSQGCVDCGEDDPIVLDFDHLRDKLRNVSRMAYEVSASKLEEEIAECVVRCANCHRLRTSTDRLTRRAVGHWAVGTFDSSA